MAKSDGFSVGCNGGRPRNTTRETGSFVSDGHPRGTNQEAGYAVSDRRPRGTIHEADCSVGVVDHVVPLKRLVAV